MMLVQTDSPGEEIALPGGGVDPGESPLQALHRELMEETGWVIEPVRRLGAYQRHTYMPEYDMWAHKICMIQLCRPVRRVRDPIEEDHLPFWADIRTAATIITASGDRAVAAALARCSDLRSFRL